MVGAENIARPVNQIDVRRVIDFAFDRHFPALAYVIAKLGGVAG
jgi:hypothetical protein